METITRLTHSSFTPPFVGKALLSERDGNNLYPVRTYVRLELRNRTVGKALLSERDGNNNKP